MRFLANENFSADIVNLLRARGHDVLWVRTDFPGADDETVLGRACLEQRILVTFDKDFGELVFARGKDASHGVVLFRIEMPTPSIAASKVASALESRGDWSGHFSVVDDSKIRMVLLPAPMP